MDASQPEEVVSVSRPFLSAALAAAVLGFGSLLLFPDCAHACSCMSAPVEKEFSWSEAVFAGEAVSVEGEGSEDRTVTFRVVKTWKGPDRGTLQVRTAASGASCGYGFEEGREYVVYAAGDRLEVNLCSATRETPSLATTDLRRLNVGQGTKPAGELPDTGGARWVTISAAIGGLGSALTLVALVGRSRRG
jgi:hypothetical protein